MLAWERNPPFPFEKSPYQRVGNKTRFSRCQPHSTSALRFVLLLVSLKKTPKIYDAHARGADDALSTRNSDIQTALFPRLRREVKKWMEKKERSRAPWMALTSQPYPRNELHLFAIINCFSHLEQSSYVFFFRIKMELGAIVTTLESRGQILT